MFYGEASAESEPISKSSSYSVAETNQSLSFQDINELLTKAAIEYGIPPEVVKAVAAQESGWKQFNEQWSSSFLLEDGGIGIMIRNYSMNLPNEQQEQLKTEYTLAISKRVSKFFAACITE